MNKTIDLWQGAEACAKGAIKAGLSFFAGYPITPSTEIAEILSVLLLKKDKTFIQMEDEIASIVAIVGASLAGAKSMTSTSGPGFSLMQEGIGYACMIETPIVICNVMRGGPSTGLPTKVAQGDVMQSKWGTHGDHPMIVICPSSVTDMYYMTIRAFNLAERFRNPVILLSDETIVHMRERVEIDLDEDLEIINRYKPDSKIDYKPYGKFKNDVPLLASIGDIYGTNITGLSHLPDGFQTADYEITRSLVERLVRKIDNYKDEIIEYEIINPDAETMIVTYGATVRSVKELIQRGNDNIGLINLKTLFPFDDERIRGLVSKSKRVIVAELNLGQIFYEVKRAIQCDKQVHFLGKVGGELIDPDEIIYKIKEVKNGN